VAKFFSPQIEWLKNLDKFGMTFDIITIFPKDFSYLNESILKRAQQKGLIKIKIHNLRDFSSDRHKKVDDKSYGGGPGMAMKADVIVLAVLHVLNEIKKTIKTFRTNRTKIILFTPAGKQFDNKIAANLAKKYQHLILICGHYEGIDARVEKIIKNLKLKIENLSIGPYVLTGGELPAMVLVDAVSRYLPGVLGKEESLEERRLGIGVPVYTRPEVFKWKGEKYAVPKVLLSGNHAEITRWRAKHRKG
jgi:tRNA (guanine37-N1)-methyltransferase